MALTLALSYGLLSFILSFLFLPTPSFGALADLLSRALRPRLCSQARISLFRHLVGTVSFLPVCLAFAPLDILLALVFSLYRPSAPPVFICGTPRSGSTLLHRLLIQSSPKLFGMTHFEWRYPSLVFQIIATISGAKSLASSKSYWKKSPVSNVVSRMHPNSMGDYEEDAILFEERVGFHPYQFLHLPVDNLIQSHTLLPTHAKAGFFSRRAKLFRLYRFTCFILRPLKNSATVFVSKEVASNDKLNSLYDFYPNSRFIVITRHPSHYLSSLKPLLEMSTISKTSSRSHLSDSAWWTSWYDWLCRQANWAANFYSAHALDSSKRVIHVNFESLIDDPRREMNRLFDFLNLPVDSHFDAVIASFESKQAKRDRGYDYVTVPYDPADYAFFLDVFYSGC